MLIAAVQVEALAKWGRLDEAEKAGSCSSDSNAAVQTEALAR